MMQLKEKQTRLNDSRTHSVIFETRQFRDPDRTAKCSHHTARANSVTIYTIAIICRKNCSILSTGGLARGNTRERSRRTHKKQSGQNHTHNEGTRKRCDHLNEEGVGDIDQ